MAGLRFWSLTTFYPPFGGPLRLMEREVLECGH